MKIQIEPFVIEGIHFGLKTYSEWLGRGSSGYGLSELRSDHREIGKGSQTKSEDSGNKSRGNKK